MKIIRVNLPRSGSGSCASLDEDILGNLMECINIFNINVAILRLRKVKL
jgi:hypothetical protein